MDKKNIGIISVIVLALLVGGYYLINAGFGSDDGTADASEFIASVNGENILRADFESQLALALSNLKAQGADVTNAELLAQLNTQVLDDIINKKLVEQGIKASNIQSTVDEIDAELQSVITQLGSEEALDAELVKNNLTKEQFLKNIEEQLNIQKFLRASLDGQNIEVTEEEIQARYDEVAEANPNIPPLEDVRSDVELQIRGEKEQAIVNAYISSLRDSASIEIFEVDGPENEVMKTEEDSDEEDNQS